MIAFMHQLAEASARAIMPHFRSALAVEDKAQDGPFDPVTEADRAGESAIRDLIRARFPDHGVIGEEFGSDRPDASHVWVLDPIDGTRSFLSGMPIWGRLIGLLRDGAPVAGLLDQPFLRERFWGDESAAWGRGSRGEIRLRTRRPAALGDAVVWIGSGVTQDTDVMARVERLRPLVRMIRYGNDCYSMAMLAEGHIDAVIETGLEIYDIAAHVPIVIGAGGEITGLDGDPAVAASDLLAAGDPDLHRAILELLGKSR